MAKYEVKMKKVLKFIGLAVLTAILLYPFTAALLLVAAFKLGFIR